MLWVKPFNSLGRINLTKEKQLERLARDQIGHLETAANL